MKLKNALKNRHLHLIAYQNIFFDLGRLRENLSYSNNKIRPIVLFKSIMSATYLMSLTNPKSPCKSLMWGHRWEQCKFIKWDTLESISWCLTRQML